MFVQAYHIDLPGWRGGSASPIIIDGIAYILLREAPWAPDVGEHALYALDMDTAEHQRIVQWDREPLGIASDGSRLFVVLEDRVEATTLEGEVVWTQPIPVIFDGPDIGRTCAPPALEGDILTVGCTEWLAENEADAGPTAPHIPPDRFVRTEIGAFALDITDGGVILWAWDSIQDRVDQAIYSPDQDPRVDGSSWVRSVGVHQDRTVLLILSASPDRELYAEVQCMDGTGKRLDRSGLYRELLAPPSSPQQNIPPPSLLVNPSHLFVLHSDGTLTQENHACDQTATRHLRDPIRPTDDLPTISVPVTGNVLGQTPNHFLVGTSWTLSAYRLPDILQRFGEAEPVWSRTIGEMDASHEVVTAGPYAYVNTWNEVHRVGLADGHVEPHALPMESTPLATVGENPTSIDNGANGHEADWFRMGLGSGYFVALRRDGNVFVFGESSASVQFHVSVPDAYPPPGAYFTLEIDPLYPGRFGSNVSYHIDWGDGGLEEEGRTGQNTHIYNRNGTTEVAVTAVNDAGQESRKVFTIHIGGMPPSSPHRPNFLEAAFSDRHQDTTWGIIGLLVVLVSALVTLWSMHRRRSILRRELQAIEDAAKASGDDGAALDRAMMERRQRVRGLLLAGTVDEPQFAVLDGRITELVRDGRLNALEERLPFLPHGMAQTIRRMLVDGHLNSWEHETLVELLDHNRFLTKAQKRQVRKQIEAWQRADVRQRE